MTERKIPQKSPYVMEIEPGTYAWCACGESSNQPYCDGSHKETPYTPVVERVSEKKTVAWCGCKRSGKAPFCDGTHNKL